MSRSSLYVIDKEYYGEEYKEYQNSWLFSPIVLDMLFWKHLPERSIASYDKTKKTNYVTASIMTTKDQPPVFRQLNEIMNNYDNLTDRIMWEFCNQQIFFAKNKIDVADAIEKFLEENPLYDKDPIPEHIVERFKEISNDIRNLPDDVECFVFKNSSCDDGVEYWFSYTDDDWEEHKTSLKDKKPDDAEWVDINDGEITFLSIDEMFTE